MVLKITEALLETKVGWESKCKLKVLITFRVIM